VTKTVDHLQQHVLRADELARDPQYAAGQPCSGGTTGDQNGTRVEVYGHYKCTGMVSGSGTKIDFEGNF